MDKIRIALAQNHSGHFASVDYADELGFYREFQVVPERLYYTSGGEAVRAVIEEKADFMISCSPLTVALKVKEGAEISIIGSDGPSPLRGSYVFARKDSSINSLSDLNGKTIGISSKNSASHIYCQALSAKAKITLNIKPLGSNRVPSLEEGKIDAIVLIPDFSFRAVASGKFKKVIDIRAELGKIGLSVLTASNQAIATKQELIHRALRAISKAIDYTQKNPKEAIDFLKKFTGQDEKVATLCYQEVSTDRSSDRFTTKDEIESYYRALTQVGMTLDLPPTEEYFNTEFIPVRY